MQSAVAEKLDVALVGDGITGRVDAVEIQTEKLGTLECGNTHGNGESGLIRGVENAGGFDYRDALFLCCVK